MNQEEVGRRLAGLHECREPFTVIFSGKKNNKVNGSYIPAVCEIIIHNRNFNADEAGENVLFYTAMHELAHHIQFTEYGQKGTRSHTKLFHAILDDLADKAEELGFYRIRDMNCLDYEIEDLICQAQTITQGIAKLQRELGAVLRKLDGACAVKGVRYEDVVKREIQISLETAQKAIKTAALDLPGSISADVQEAIAGERDEDKRKAMAAAAQAGRSVAQVKRAGSPPAARTNESEAENLLREQRRLIKAIEELQRRLKDVMTRLHTPGGLSPPRAAERRDAG
jgi:predicted SprT family Zn-dependent metalloprotease